MEDQYGMGDLRHYMNGRPIFPPPPPPPDLLSGHRGLPPSHQYDMVMMGARQLATDHLMPRAGLHPQHHQLIRSDSTTSATTTPSITGTSSAGLAGGLDMEVAACGVDGGSGRWPRQETLTLLEIRSRLDSKFKEANQKGPLWDEVSRIMSEEYGYQRSGKKCREKFENLYKYYKKTKDGKAGRQDGKHYRFFRQLEALYGGSGSSINAAAASSASEIHHFGGAGAGAVPYNQDVFQAPKLSAESLSLSNSSDFDTNSSDDSDVNVTTDNDSLTENRKKRKGKRSWKTKIKSFIDAQMRKLIEKQEVWLDKMMKTIENKEQERMLREEEWRKQEVSRIDREHKFWANERAWIEARDAALMETLHKITGKELKAASDHQLRSTLSENQNDNGSETITTTTNTTLRGDHQNWPECEITRLLQLRTGMEQRFREISSSQELLLWEEIAAKMSCFGYDRSGLTCKDKWDGINDYLMKCNEKKKDSVSSRSSRYFQNSDPQSICSLGGAYGDTINHYGSRSHLTNDHGAASPPNCSTGNTIHDSSSFRYLMGDAAADHNLWENYGMKLLGAKGGGNH